MTDPVPQPDVQRQCKDRRWARWLGNLAAAVLGVLAAAVVVEVTILLVKGEQPKFPRRVVAAPWGLRYNEPGGEYRHKSADGSFHFRINNQGMRADRDYPYEKPPGVSRILSLGDSFTIGFEVDVERCFSSVLERELRNAGHSVEVLNAGVSGFSTAEEYLYLKRELIKYTPDLVLVSFFANDLADNERANLFRIENGTLIQSGETYLPGGRLADWLNENPLLNMLSERSNSFVFLKESVTDVLKGRLARANHQNPGTAEAGGTNPKSEGTSGNSSVPEVGDASESQQQLAAAILDGMYVFLRERAIPFVIHSIPTMVWDRNELIEAFPIRFVDWRQPGLYFVPSKEALDPFVGKTPLVWQRSHFHWTPFSHEVAGKNLAKVILDRNLLQNAASTARVSEQARSQSSTR